MSQFQRLNAVFGYLAAAGLIGFAVAKAVLRWT